MVIVADIINRIIVVLLVLTIIASLVYIIPILFVRRFHTLNNVFTINLSFTTISCSIFWLIITIISTYFSDYHFDSVSCYLLNFFGLHCTIQVPLTLVEVSVHRLCSIIYHTKPFFKTKRWATLCIISQWMTGIILSLPLLSPNNMVRI